MCCFAAYLVYYVSTLCQKSAYWFTSICYSNILDVINSS